MRLDTAKKVFAHMMQVARTRPLGPTEKKGLALARQTLRRAARPAMNPDFTKQQKKTLSRAMRVTTADPLQTAHSKMPTTDRPRYARTRVDSFSSPTQKGRLHYQKSKLPNGATLIYGRCLRIEAVKMVAHNYGGEPVQAGQKYFHDFTSKNAVIYGLPDGSLLIKAK